MERGLVSHIAMNGAGPIHDWEFALVGATTESVARYIQTGNGALANAGRNTIQMPAIYNWDFSLGKRFHLSESKYFEFRSDFIPGMPLDSAQDHLSRNAVEMTQDLV